MDSEKRINVQFAIVIILLLAVIGVMQNRIDELNRADAFYRWMIALDARADLSGTGVADTTDVEKELFADVRTVGSELASLRWPAITDILGDDATPDQKWEIARSKPLYKQRLQFSELLREGRLEGAKGVIDWQEEGVGQQLGSLILGFRTAVADLLWLKVDEYWHAGDRYRMLSTMFTVVRLDPHFLDAYAIGAWHMAYNIVESVTSPEEKQEYTDKAIAFLKDGIEKNPFEWQLYGELGFGIYFVRMEDWTNAVKYLELAYKYGPPIWYQRSLYSAYEKNGQYQKSLDGWSSYAEEHPDNEIAPRMVLEIKAQMAYENGDDDEAVRLWRQIYNDPRFRGVRSRADAGITMVQAKRAEREGRDMDALRLWRSLVVKKYPDVLTESLDNISRLRVKLGMPPLEGEGDIRFWQVLDNAKADEQG